MPLLVGIPDKKIAQYLKYRNYMVASDEGEAVGIAAGYYLATGKRATVFMSADGFCNALNPITSYLIPEKIQMDFIIGTGRQEPHHKVMSDSLYKIIKAICYDARKLDFSVFK